ncbi:MAG TPA: TIGR02281 family clan AA aspartic protease [Hyphomicrobiaceae bacterium]|nr:TIGR02281 family clan AA aspartic protease [Hyphomicrobiaceae bacterium]
MDAIRAYIGPGEPREPPVATLAGVVAPSSADADKADRQVRIRASSSGHFETKVRLNGRHIDVLVDTGATLVALTYEDAVAAGISPRDSDFKFKVSTANGEAYVAQVMIDEISIDDIVVRNVRGVVAERGKLGVTLLGMSFLSRLGKTEMTRDMLVLQQ